MRGTLLVCVLLLAGSVAFAQGAFLQERELGGGWEVVAEAPVFPGMDPDLAAWGVREKRVRHYTRDFRGRVQVCSVEVWRFESEGQASAAAGEFAFPDWQIERVGESVVMVHGLERRRDGGGPRRGVFPECDRIGERIRARSG